MAAVATIDGHPGRISLAPGTRIIAGRAFTYDVSAYYALHWKDQAKEEPEQDTFTVPSSVIHIGEYGLLDVGKPITYNGFLVGWDALTAGDYTGLIRTVSGEPVTVTCLDGTTETKDSEAADVRLSGGTTLEENGVFFGGYLSYTGKLNTAYYTWLTNPEGFDKAPDQFITIQEIFGTQNRVLTAEELRSVRLSMQGFLGKVLAEYIVSRRCQAVAAHTTVVLLLVCCLAI